LWSRNVKLDKKLTTFDSSDMESLIQTENNIKSGIKSIDKLYLDEYNEALKLPGTSSEKEEAYVTKKISARMLYKCKTYMPPYIHRLHDFIKSKGDYAVIKPRRCRADVHVSIYLTAKRPSNKQLQVIKNIKELTDLLFDTRTDMHYNLRRKGTKKKLREIHKDIRTKHGNKSVYYHVYTVGGHGDMQSYCKWNRKEIIDLFKNFAQAVHRVNRQNHVFLKFLECYGYSYQDMSCEFFTISSTASKELPYTFEITNKDHTRDVWLTLYLLRQFIASVCDKTGQTRLFPDPILN